LLDYTFSVNPSYTEPNKQGFSLKVNGKSEPIIMEKGFATINRTWAPRDLVELKLPMPVKFNKAIEQVQADRNRIAVTMGPLVYCAEGVDNSGSVQRFFIDELPTSQNIETETKTYGLMNNITEISLPVKAIKGNIVMEEKMTLIPYYAWNNRGDSSMIVWFPKNIKKQ